MKHRPRQHVSIPCKFRYEVKRVLYLQWEFCFSRVWFLCVIVTGTICVDAFAQGVWIEPSDTDDGIEIGDAPHYVVAPASSQRGELLIFFPGAGARPEEYTEFINHAGSLGYHAVGLSYPNDKSINFDYCGDAADGSCHEFVRREILEGIDLSDQLSVDPANSILNRITKLLAHLNDLYPEEGWLHFLTDNELINWRDVSVAGHSQGAGHAGFIAKNHSVRRCVLFAGADWSFTEQAIAYWLNWPAVTPPARIYFFTHERDTTPSLILSRMMWVAYMIADFGPEIRVDSTDDYQESHTLTTNLEPAEAGNFHQATIVNNAIPRNEQGENLLLATWQYLLTHQRNEPGERIGVIQATEEVMISPDIDGEALLFAYQDPFSNLWVGKIDPSTGMFIRDSSYQKIDTDLNTIQESRKGPEFYLGDEGTELIYIKRLNELPSIWSASKINGEWQTQLLSPSDGIARGGAIGTDSASWERPAIAYWYEDGANGEVRWAWADGPFEEEITLGDIQSGSTPLRWALDGKHIFFTLDVEGISQLFVHDTQTLQSTQLTDVSSGIVNPIVWESAPQEEALLVGGVVNQEQIHIFTYTPGGEFILKQVLEVPTAAQEAGYTLIGSPEGFMFDERWFVSMEIANGELGRIPDAQIWVLECLRPEGGISLRCDDGVEGALRADPEWLLTRDEVYLYYQQFFGEGPLKQIRVRTGLAPLIRGESLQVSSEQGNLQLEWDDRAELRIERSEDLEIWDLVDPMRSPATVDPSTHNQQFWRLRPNQL